MSIKSTVLGNISGNHIEDQNGNPAGGTSLGPGTSISWQNGPMVDSEGNPIMQNGAFPEDIINAIIDRINYYQSTKFYCADNQEIIHHLTQAQEVVQRRQQAREARGVRGTHEA